MRSTLRKITQKLKSYPRIAALLTAAEQTPHYAVHWYIVLILGVMLGMVLFALGLFSFGGVTRSAETALPSARAAGTFNQKELQEILEVYETQISDYTVLRTTAPNIVDPGR